jgi:hypothetical protein
MYLLLFFTDIMDKLCRLPFKKIANGFFVSYLLNHKTMIFLLSSEYRVVILDEFSVSGLRSHSMLQTEEIQQ